MQMHLEHEHVITAHVRSSSLRQPLRGSAPTGTARDFCQCVWALTLIREFPLPQNSHNACAVGSISVVSISVSGSTKYIRPILHIHAATTFSFRNQ